MASYPNNNSIMSSEEYTKKTDKVRKELNTLRKDINYRDEQDKRGEATYSIDAEINGQFNQIVSKVISLERGLVGDLEHGQRL